MNALSAQWPTDALLVLAALLIDRFVGEPPNALHPVVWIGRVTKLLSEPKLAQQGGPRVQLLWGACIALVVPGAFACATFVLLQELQPWPASLFVVSALLLKASLSLDGLRKAAVTMRGALQQDITAARYALRNLCSRDPSALSERQLTAATIESLAENTADSVIAPLFYFALFGVPGAIAYRAVNTLDAMIGYHGRYEYLGKAAARLDDVLNIIPARLTALLLLVAGAVARCGGPCGVRGAVKITWRDARKTESPNAGFPMAAMAGLLGVTLEKEGHYVLGDATRAVEARDIDRVWRIVRHASWLGAVIVMLVLGVRHAFQ